MPALLAAVEQSLAATGRILSAVVVDGRSNDGELSVEHYAASRRIEFQSMTIEAATEQLASVCRTRAAELHQEAATVAGLVLCEPWATVVPKVVALAERLAALLNDLGTLSSAQTWAALAEALGAGLHRWMDAITARDAVRVCLELDRGLLPLLEQLASPNARSEDTPR